MTTPLFEAFLAKLYVDPELVAEFLNDSKATALAAGLSDSECQALEKIDRVGLEMAATSFRKKRASQCSSKP